LFLLFLLLNDGKKAKYSNLAPMEGKIPRFWAGIGMTAGTVPPKKAISFCSLLIIELKLEILTLFSLFP
jgi:hypothetical protein